MSTTGIETELVLLRAERERLQGIIEAQKETNGVLLRQVNSMLAEAEGMKRDVKRLKDMIDQLAVEVWK